MKIPRPYVRPDEMPSPPRPSPLPQGGALTPAGHSLSCIQIDGPPVQRSPDPDIDQSFFERTGQLRPPASVPDPGVSSPYSDFESPGQASSPYSPIRSSDAAPPHTTPAEERTTQNTLPVVMGGMLKGFSPGAEYAGEDTKLGWRADIGDAAKAKRDSPDPAVRQAHAALAARGDVRVTKYLSEEQRAGFETTAGDDGLLRGAGGGLLDTKGGGGGGHDATADAHIFALGTEGKLHTASDKENDFARKDFIDRKSAEGIARSDAAAMAGERGLVDRSFHHSSFYAGGAVAGAGEIRADQGRLKEITDGSGHYKPGGEATFQTVEHMARSKAEGGLGIGMRDEDEREARVTLIGKGADQQRVSLPASSYLQTQGNETQIRAKERMLGQIRGRDPVSAQPHADAAPALGGPDFGRIAHAPRQATVYADGSQLIPRARPATVYEDQSSLGPPAAGPIPATAYADASALGSPSSGPYSPVRAGADEALPSDASPYSVIAASGEAASESLASPSATPYSMP